MANEMVQGLLQNLLQPQQGPAPADIMAALSSRNPMAAVSAMQAPQLSQMFGQQFRGLIGGLRGQPAAMTGNEAYTQAVQQLSAQPDFMNTSESLAKLAAAASAVGRTPEAMQFSMLASQRKMEEQELTKQQQLANQQAAQQQSMRQGYSNLIVNSPTLNDQQKTDLAAIAASGGFDGKTADLLKLAYPSSEGRFSMAGNQAVWDNQTGTWAVGASPADAAKTTGGAAIAAPTVAEALPGFDADQYDPQSIGRANNAYRQAATPQEKEAALALLKPKARAGEEWRTVNGVSVLYPVSGEPRREANQAIAAANGSRQTARRNAENFIDISDNILKDIYSGKSTAGAKGALLGFVPGTTYWDQRVSIDTLKANLGIDALFEARRNSANGSSGFGQLTQMELKRLEDRVRSLSLAQTEGQFVENLTKLREDYVNILNKDGGEMTIEDYIGINRPTSVQTSSGRYTVEEVNQ
jgi:hypothetical protein